MTTPLRALHRMRRPVDPCRPAAGRLRCRSPGARARAGGRSAGASGAHRPGQEAERIARRRELERPDGGIEGLLRPAGTDRRVDAFDVERRSRVVIGPLEAAGGSQEPRARDAGRAAPGLDAPAHELDPGDVAGGGPSRSISARIASAARR